MFNPLSESGNGLSVFKDVGLKRLCQTLKTAFVYGLYIDTFPDNRALATAPHPEWLRGLRKLKLCYRFANWRS